ncbi:MAG: ABC transporter permease, partial [Bacteroidetes bacterium]
KQNEKNFFFADPNFLDIFDFPLQIGDRKTALKKPNAIILTTQMAEKYFGKENPIGKILTIQNKYKMVVTGVFSEIMPASHLKFDFICNFASLENDPDFDKIKKDWVWNPAWTYLVFQRDVSVEEVNRKIEDFGQKHLDSVLRKVVYFDFQAVQDIHLTSNLDYEIDKNADKQYIFINFVNLSTARSSLRAKEVVARKVLGASRQELIFLFIGESLFFSFLAVLLALIFVEMVFPFLEDLSGNPLNPMTINQFMLIISTFGVGLLLGFLAGLYPAFYLSSYQPSNVLKGNLLIGKGSQWFRKALVAVQFVIAIFMLISSTVVKEQLIFLTHKNLGFDKEQKLIVTAPELKSIKNYENFKVKMMQSAEILNVTAMESIFGKTHQTRAYDLNSTEKNNFNYFPSMLVQKDFVQTFELKLLAGRDFIQKKTDSIQKGELIINKEMLCYLNLDDPKKAIGKEIIKPNGKKIIVGVVENFHFSSLHEKISPFILDLANTEREKNNSKYFAISVTANQNRRVREILEKNWRIFFPNQALDYFYLNENLNAMYFQERKLNQISTWFSWASVFIAAMGLFGLSSFMVEQRRKEIGIRKALGANIFELMYFFSKEFLWLAFFSAALAVPLSFFLLNNWLQTFPYHVDWALNDFYFGIGTILVLTLLIIALHTFRTIFQTPIKEINS